MKIASVRMFILGTVVTSIFSGTANAASIGMQFTGFDSTRTLPSTAVAGIVPADNFNTISGYGNGSFDYRDGGTHPLPSLVDSSGAATAVTGTASGFSILGVFGSAATPSNNDLLMSHDLGVTGTQFGNLPVQTGTLSFSNLNASGYTSYDVIAYLALDTGANNNHPSTISLNGGTAIPVSIYGASSYETPDVTFIDASSAAGVLNGGNYVEFTGLTADSVSVAITSAPYYNSVGFAGIQIIQETAVPEPGVAGLGLVGGMGLLAVRRRRHA